LRGRVATRYSWRDRKIDVLVRLSEEERQSIDAVRELIVNPESERPVPLSSVAEIVVAEGPSEIRRSDQERVALIQANLAFGDSARASRKRKPCWTACNCLTASACGLPARSEEMEASFNSLWFALALAVFLVYLVMASQFESLLHPS